MCDTVSNKGFEFSLTENGFNNFLKGNNIKVLKIRGENSCMNKIEVEDLVKILNGNLLKPNEELSDENTKLIN